MVVDYSRFENIELSDDSDIEVHPNVDKNSFIKWKQRDIHEKRLQRNAQINQITVNLLMYGHLNKRVDLLLESPVDLVNEAQAFLFLNSKFDKDETFQSELVDPKETLPYNEQIEDLVIQLKHDLLKESKEVNNENLRESLKGHKLKIDKLIIEQKSTLQKLQEEKLSHIEMDDLKEGFSSTIINKSTSSSEPSNLGSDKKTVIETINSPSLQPLTKKPSKPLDQLKELELLDETVEFSKLPQDDLLLIHRFLAEHLYIISEQQKDALLMTAFDAELADNHHEAKNIVYKALLLRFLDELLSPIKNHDDKLKSLNTFMSRIRIKNHPASKAFLQEVDFTYNHIKTRSKVIREEESKRVGDDDDEEEALIQLKTTDDNTKIVVHVPTEEEKESYEYFQQLPKDMQEALKTEDLDEINKAFANMKLKDAEKCLEIMNTAGIVGVDIMFETEEEFEEMKANMLKDIVEVDSDDDSVIHNTGSVIQEEEEEEELSTADIVD